jgi:hypothetical protein
MVNGVLAGRPQFFTVKNDLDDSRSQFSGVWVSRRTRQTRPAEQAGVARREGPRDLFGIVTALRCHHETLNLESLVDFCDLVEPRRAAVRRSHPSLAFTLHARSIGPRGFFCAPDGVAVRPGRATRQSSLAVRVVVTAMSVARAASECSGNQTVFAAHGNVVLDGDFVVAAARRSIVRAAPEHGSLHRLPASHVQRAARIRTRSRSGNDRPAASPDRGR